MDSIDLLRHTLAALGYRTLRAVHRAPDGFETFRAGPASRPAGEILAHMGDLMAWARRHAQGESKWVEIPASGWDADRDRFFNALTQFDLTLKDRGVTDELAQRLFQGPVADALTHCGQLALLRGLAGAPVQGENYYVADIVAGRTTQIQPPPRRTF